MPSEFGTGTGTGTGIRLGHGGAADSNEADAPVETLRPGPGSALGPGGGTLVLLDYDDTLFATQEHLRAQRKQGPTPHMSEAWAHHDVHVAALLLAFHRAGCEVRIVTNAVTGWIEHTSRWMPRTRAVLRACRIPAVSARGTRAPTSTEAVVGWKEETFRAAVERARPRHVLCIGDSFVEHEALRRVCARAKQPVRRSFVWLHREPCICLLSRQLDRVRSAVGQMLRPEKDETHIVLRPQTK